MFCYRIRVLFCVAIFIVEVVVMGVDDKLSRWNEIFDELLLDANSLVKDLRDSVGYVGAAGFLMIVIGMVFFGYNVFEFWRGTLFIGLVCLFTGIDFALGVVIFAKFFQLRSRYSRLIRLEGKLK